MYSTIEYMEDVYEPEDFYYTSTSSSESSDESSSSEDDEEVVPATSELVIYVQIDDEESERFGNLPKFKLRCGSGRNTFRWLAMVAAQRYSQLSKSHGTARVRERFHSNPGQYAAKNIKHLESERANHSSVLEGLRRRSTQLHSTAVLRAAKSSALKINPRSSLRELLCSGDTVTVVLSAVGNAFCVNDGRFVARSNPEVTSFSGAAFHTSSAGQMRHEARKTSLMIMEQEQRHTRMIHAANVLFGDDIGTELTDRDLAKEASIRESHINNMFVMDWMTLDLHGILKIQDRPNVKNVLKEYYGILLKVFDHFSTIGVDFVFQAITHSLSESLNAERCSIWIVDYDKKELWTKASSGTAGYQIHIPMHTGIIGDCIDRGQIVNIPDAYKDHRFSSAVDKETGFVTTQVLCVPAKSSNGKVLGALQIINRAKIKKYVDDEGNIIGEAFSNNSRDQKEVGGRRRTAKITLKRRGSAIKIKKFQTKMVVDNRPFTRAEEIDCEHVAERFGRELKLTKMGADDNCDDHSKDTNNGKNDGDGGRTGGMSMPEFHKMCDSLGFFELAATDNPENIIRDTSSRSKLAALGSSNGTLNPSKSTKTKKLPKSPKSKYRLTDEKLDHMFNNLITRRDLRQQHSSGNRRKGRDSMVGGMGTGMVHPEALDRQSFLLLIIWISKKAYEKLSDVDDDIDSAQCLLQLIKRHILPHSKLFVTADIKTVMLEEENAQVLLEHVQILKLLFIRYKDVGELDVMCRKHFMDMCKEVDVYRFGLKHDDIVRIFKISGSDLGGKF